MSPKARVAQNLRATRRRVDTADHFRLMADYAPVMIWLADPQGRSVYFNRTWLAFRGRALEDELDLGWTEGVHPDDRDRCLAAQLEALEGRKPYEIELRLRRADGEDRGVRMNGVPIVDGKRLAGFVGSCVDITEHLAAREREAARRAGELERERVARASAEAAAHARDQFLSIVSHELRSPLNGIKSWTHVLENYLRESDDPGMRRAIDGIMVGVDQQVSLIEDLLDMTRALSGNLALAKRPMPLGPALLEAVEGSRALAGEKGVHLDADAASAQVEIDGDPDRIHRMFSNLVGNAIKFTPAGGHVGIRATTHDGMACVEVRDDGAGIPVEFLPYVFDPFRQAEPAGATNRPRQGLGVGLALVQRLAELHGGRATCESQGRGHGATFRVYLPLRVGGQRPAAVALGTTTAASLPSLAGIKVMVIDDQPEHRESLGALLEQAGASVVLAASGQEAVKRLERRNESDEPDVIVCDIAMPTDDGYATLHRIRAWEAAHGVPRCPAIAISAFTQREDRVRALSAGFQMHLVKPVVPAELIVVIASVARRLQRA